MTTATRHASTGNQPLESGDRLTRAEFERRYSCRPDIKKAELIVGVVYVASPVRLDKHGEQHVFVIHWLADYRMTHPGIRVGDNSTVRLDLDNEAQPDVTMFREGGRSSLDEDGYVVGAPELVVEIAASSASYDLHDKLRVYRRNGVQEYVVWQILEGRVDWFRLRAGEYLPLLPDANGVIYSDVFPGLCLPVEKMLKGDMAAVLAAQNSKKPRAAPKRS